MSKKPEISVGSKVWHFPNGFDSKLFSDAVGTVVAATDDDLFGDYFVDFGGCTGWYGSCELYLVPAAEPKKKRSTGISSTDIST